MPENPKISKIQLPDGTVYDIEVNNLKNILDGSQSGSIRTLNSKTEGSTYWVGENSFEYTIGENAFAEGYQTIAANYSAHAEGTNSIASGDSSHAEGEESIASGFAAHAEGNGRASGDYSHAEGISTANGESSHAEGMSTASGLRSHTEGYSTTTTVDAAYSHAEGYQTIAQNHADHAEGMSTTAAGGSSHAEGQSTRALGVNSHAEGLNTRATNRSQHVFGEYNVLDPNNETPSLKGSYIQIVGNGASNSSRSNARTLDWSGNEVVAGKVTAGADATASADLVRLGQLGTAAMLDTTTSITSGGTDLPTAGAVYTAIQDNIPTETDPTVPAWAKASTKPSYNFSEINSTPTSISGYGITDAYTKTEIDSLVASVLHYKGTKATVSALPASGNTLGDVWHITADGSEWAWDGTEWQELGTAIDLSGYLQTGDIADWAKASTKPSYTASEISGAVRVDGSYGSPAYAYGVYGLASTGTVQIPVYSATITNDNQITTKKYVDDAISGISSLQHILDGSQTGSIRQINATVTANNAAAFNSSSTASGAAAFASGLQTLASGQGSFSQGNNTKATGSYTHAEGTSTLAQQQYSHAEGIGSTAGGGSYGWAAHAEGAYTLADGHYSHAEGYGSTTSGQQSHAQGAYTSAKGDQSHAQGMYTIAQRASQHVFGQYNIADTTGSGVSSRGAYVQIVGNGTSSNTRSNAYTLDWSGNGVYAGKVTLGSTGSAAMDVVTNSQLSASTKNLTFTMDTTDTKKLVITYS